MEQLRVAVATWLVWMLVALPASASDVTIPNTFSNGTTADATQVNANFDAVETAIDDNDSRLDTVEGTVQMLSGTIDQDDIIAAVAAACTANGNRLEKCKEVVLPKGTITVTAPIYLTGTGLAPSASSGEGVWGLKIRGAGGNYLRGSPANIGSQSECGTTIVYSGSSSAPVFQIHGGRGVSISDLCVVMDGGQDGANPATDAFLVTANTSEVSHAVMLNNVDIWGFSDDWTENNSFTSTCIRLAPDDYGGGEPPYSSQAQIDNFVVNDSRLQCHQVAVLANGFTFGNFFLNSIYNAGTNGFVVEDADLHIYGGYSGTFPRYGQSGGEATACAAFGSMFKVGSTSSQQPKIVSVVSHNSEGDCGRYIDTVDATDPGDQRDDTLYIAGSTITWGAASVDNVINYTHHGVFEIVGSYIGIRNSEDYTSGSREFINLAPISGGTLYTRLSADNLGDWDAGSFQVTTNAQVTKSIGSDDIAADAIDSSHMANADHGDISWSGGVASVDANAVALSTDTTGNYVATIADSGASEVTVSGSGSEGAAVTLAIASTITRDSELRAFTVSASAASGSCTAGDLWLKTSATVTLYACTATDTWSTGVGI